MGWRVGRKSSRYRTTSTKALTLTPSIQLKNRFSYETFNPPTTTPTDPLRVPLQIPYTKNMILLETFKSYWKFIGDAYWVEVGSD